MLTYIMDYQLKYEKYKAKYLELINELHVNQSGGSSKKPELYLFKADWCLHCKQFKQKWINLSNSSLTKKVNFITLDEKINRKQIDEWGINGFPTLILKNGHNAIEYTGEKTENNIINFINKNIN